MGMGMLSASTLFSSSLILKSTTGCAPLIYPSPNITPAFATLTFDSKPTAHSDLILESTPSVDATSPSLNQVNPKTPHNGTLLHEATPNITHNGSSLPSNRALTTETLNALPAILPPSHQLHLSDLLRRDFDDARTFPEAVCNAADTLITQLLSPGKLLPSVDPQVQLIGNSAPVAETPPTPCFITGELPSDLNGAYLRNGPNATHLHRGEGYHVFDGNGMIHSVKIEDGNATYCARYVKTSRFQQERAAGRPLFPKFFGGLSGISGAARTAVVGLRAVFGLLDVTKGWGLSNTSVGFFNGQVLSMSEDDMPYVIKVTESGDLVTVGHFKLPGTFNMCAHPKFDVHTGEMFAFSFKPPSIPPFSLFRVSADGIRSRDVPVPLLDVPLVHDFAITRNYVVFPDNQLVIRPVESIRGESALVADEDKTPRFCLLPRYALPEEAASKAQWFETPGCNCLHYINAWEEGHEVVLITPVLSPPKCILEVPAVNLACTLTEVRLNMTTGRARSQKLCVGNFEFGTMNQKYVGRRCRYVYLANGCFPELTGVVKVDLHAAAAAREEVVVARREYGEGCTGGEPFFVPRKGSKSTGEQLEEDDGYLLCYVHNEGTGLSEMQVMDARSPSLQVIAAVQLPARVPAGFHGWFVSQEQLTQQA